MKLSYSAVWKDTVELLRANAAAVAALAGVFIFLPALAMAYLLPYPEPTDPKLIMNMWVEYLNANWHWFILSSIIGMIGAIAIFLLFLEPKRSTVGGTISTAVMILPFYFLASLVSGFIIGIGFILLIVPGLYLIGRLSVVTPVVVAEGQRNPIAAVTRSFELTRGSGWALFGLIILVALTASIISGVASTMLGILFLLVAGQDVGTLLTKIVQTLGSAATVTLIYALTAAIYRQLRGTASDAEAFR
ncbi:MAG: hypothetical protein ACXW2T_11210 [Allosphingosinicella sp.]